MFSILFFFDFSVIRVVDWFVLLIEDLIDKFFCFLLDGKGM
jgi:hypothetical protein